MNGKEKIKTKNQAKLRDIIRAFWRGMKPQHWAFYLMVITFGVFDVANLVVPLYYKKFFDIITVTSNKAATASALVHVLIIIFLINAAAWFIFRIGLFTTNHLEANTMSRLRQISFDHLVGHSHSFFADNFSGSLVQRVNRFSRAFENLCDVMVFNVLPLVIQVVGVIIVVWLQQPFIAEMMLVWVLISLVGNYAFSTWKLKYDLRSSSADSATTARLSDDITNQATIISFAGSSHEKDEFKKVSLAQARATWTAWDLSSVFDSVQAGLMVLIEFFVFYYGIHFWQAGTITVGTFVLIQVYILGLAQQLWGFSRIVRTIYQSIADAEEMVSLLILPHEIQNIPDASPLAVQKGEIILKDTSFAFGENQPVLKDLNLTIAGGEKIAVIGPSGAGKSTLVRLILRLYNLKEGRITIDNQDIQKVTQESLRESISLVPQDPILFHRSLMENIRYGRRDATDEEVIKAAKLAHCDDFIDALPLKYETFVGERGVKLSGGERQRVAIARAILKNAPILILDEATSSLDSHSESLIQDALDKLMKDKTVIVIAHRLSTIRKMDRIIVLENGKIIEEGTHEDLLDKKESLYKNLWSLQAGGFLAS